MTTAADLLALAERVEREEPSFDLVCDIARATGACISTGEGYKARTAAALRAMAQERADNE